MIDKKESFNFKRYTYTPRGIYKAQLFKEYSKEINVTPRESILVKAQALLGIVAPSLLP